MQMFGQALAVVLGIGFLTLQVSSAAQDFAHAAEHAMQGPVKVLHRDCVLMQTLATQLQAACLLSSSAWPP